MYFFTQFISKAVGSLRLKGSPWYTLSFSTPSLSLVPGLLAFTFSLNTFFQRQSAPTGGIVSLFQSNFFFSTTESSEISGFEESFSVFSSPLLFRLKYPVSGFTASGFVTCTSKTSVSSTWAISEVD